MYVVVNWGRRNVAGDKKMVQVADSGAIEK